MLIKFVFLVFISQIAPWTYAMSRKNLCSLDPDFGGCSAYTQQFYYNRFTGECHEFIYGGCLGNSNNFETKEECQDFCEGMEVEKVCDEKPDKGPCEGYMPRYYFDEDSQECDLFIYRGCRGNPNNFRTQKECMETCSKQDEKK